MFMPENRETIHRFIVAFYSRVRLHDRLGPIFNSRLEGHWDAHFERLTDFWMTVLTGTPAYKGNPFGVHLAISEITPDLFSDWLGLFEKTAHEELKPELAALAVEKSQRIAESLKGGLFFRPGQPNATAMSA